MELVIEYILSLSVSLSLNQNYMNFCTLGLNGQISVSADFEGHAGQFVLHIRKCMHARFFLKQDQRSQVIPQVAK